MSKMDKNLNVKNKPAFEDVSLAELVQTQGGVVMREENGNIITCTGRVISFSKLFGTILGRLPRF